MSNFIKPKGVRADGTPYSTQISAKADKVVTEDGDSTHLKTYAAHIKLDAPLPAPRSATTRMIEDEFVWYRLFQTKGRGKAVEEAAEWFRNVKRKDYAKSLKGKATHECVVVDDPWNECSYGTEFTPTRSVNRLLDDSTIERVLKESEGKLKRTDKPFEKGKVHPSIEWVEGAKRVNDAPIKIGLISVDPKKMGMKESIEKAVKRAKARKKNKQLPWIKEVENQDIRKLVRKMREEGTIEHSSAYRKRVGKRSAKPKVVAKKKVSEKQKEILKAELDEWIKKEERKSFRRKKE